MPVMIKDKTRHVLSPHCMFREETFHASDKHNSRNSKQGSNDCIVVMGIMLLSTCC